MVNGCWLIKGKLNNLTFAGCFNDALTESAFNFSAELGGAFYVGLGDSA